MFRTQQNAFDEAVGKKPVSSLVDTNLHDE